MKLARKPVVLAIGDLGVFLLFAAIGRADHGLPFGDNPLLTVLWTATPFALAWFAVAWPAGVFGAAVRAHPRALLGRTALAWLAAGAPALLLRALLNGQPTVAVSFALVALGVNMAFLLAWHGGYGWMARAKK